MATFEFQSTWRPRSERLRASVEFSLPLSRIVGRGGWGVRAAPAVLRIADGQHRVLRQGFQTSVISVMLSDH